MGFASIYTKATSVIFGIYALQMILIPANMVSLLDRPSRTATDSSIGPPSPQTPRPALPHHRLLDRPSLTPHHPQRRYAHTSER